MNTSLSLVRVRIEATCVAATCVAVQFHEHTSLSQQRVQIGYNKFNSYCQQNNSEKLSHHVYPSFPNLFGDEIYIAKDQIYNYNI